MNAPNQPLDGWTRRYESLRQCFLDPGPWLAAAPLGLTVFLRQGVAGWMRAWSWNRPVEIKPAEPSASAWRSAIAPGWQQELTRLIAHMTTPHLSLTPQL